ncbi:high frequency lysogenization protein HflD [Granulosicoccaceae sp. 1_MG-2023]|nr:high frequency lysogenization protein HflD [Granulosicoccaceae sp. 1_MG-2023]
MLKNLQNQTIALAAVFQGAWLVKQLAHQGRYDADAFEASLKSVIGIDADSVEAIYDHNRGVRQGLKVLCDQLSNVPGQRDDELSRYAITLLHLESRLRGDFAIHEKLRQGITQLEAQHRLYGLSDTLIHNTAELYRDTISQLRPRIMVNGESRHLANEATAARIRAMLLASIRGAVLWRQCGGSRLRLLFKRNDYLRQARELLDQMPAAEEIAPPQD